MPDSWVAFSPLANGPAKLVLMGPPGAAYRQVIDWARSLHETEHVSASDLIRAEIARGSAAGVALSRTAAGAGPASEPVLGLVRRWFWSRKSSRGFILTGFPRNVAEALVFDEWLESRDETLSGCILVESDENRESGDPEALSRAALARHYAERGLLVRLDPALPVESSLAAWAETLPTAAACR